MIKHIKVCLICHFSNQEVRSRIGFAHGVTPMGDFAVWNTELIKYLSKRPDIELHVIAPMLRMKHFTQRFKIGNVSYYFYKPDVPIIHKGWPHYFPVDAWTHYFYQRILVQKWIRDISPDIVNLVGAENPYYSASILGLKGFPALISIQGIYSNPERFKCKCIKENKNTSKFERKVHSENRYFTVSAPFMPALIKRDSPYAELLWWKALIADFDESKFSNTAKSYDFVQFSRLNKNKGVEDTIFATKLVCVKYPNVKVRVFGPIGRDYLYELQRLIQRLGVSQNIILTGGFENHNEVLYEAAKGVNYILPTYVEAFASTILEATKLGMPVVSYKTGDIPKLNVGEERILLSDIGDVDGLANNMLRLLDNPFLGDELNRKARNFVSKYFSNEFNGDVIVEIYKAVIENYHNGIAIPEDLYYEHFLERRMTTNDL